nr:uncharacterized protein LOC100182713 [Ciona intestinalis]|eukprot:XP_002130671.1 uncharacterized protein LOC100182713 [Ciona intestinalis]
MNGSAGCRIQSLQKDLKRSPNWSPFEIRILCEFVKENKTQLFGSTKKTKGVNANKKKMWEKAASSINASSGRNRDWIQVRKKWKDLSYYAKNCQRKSNTNEEVGEPLDSEATNSGNENGSQRNLEAPALEPDEITTSSNVTSSSQSTLSDISIKSEPENYHIISDCTDEIFNEKCTDISSGTVITTQQSGNQANKEIHGRTRAENVQAAPYRSSQNFASTPNTSCHEKILISTPTCSETGRYPENYAFASADPLISSPEGELRYYRNERLKIEREKLALQKGLLESLRDISYSARKISDHLVRRKRRRRSGGFQPSSKRRNTRPSRRRTQSESTDTEY